VTSGEADTGLQEMKEKELAATYGVSRDTARKARNAVVSEIAENLIRDK
jgi:DNA-binding GntR family transcriptional regulator